MTITRSILLGCLGLGTLLTGCPFEEPPMIDMDGSGTAGATAGTTMVPTTETNTTMPTTAGPTTAETTMDPTVEPTTVASLDTTADSTTTQGSATESTSATDTTTTGSCSVECDGIACGTVDACDCGECGPMATCADDQSYCAVPVGFFNDFGANALVNGQVQLGFRFQVFVATTVRRLGVIAGGAGANVRLALYDHDGAGPANRLVQTGAVALYANGNNEYDVGATAIAPGDYWVMLHTEGSTPLRRTFNGDNMYEEAVRGGIPFAAGFPVAMDDEMVLNDYRYNVYMVVEE
jgi:hypothetical protein